MKQFVSVLLFAVLLTYPCLSQAQSSNSNHYNFYKTYTSALGLEDGTALSFAGNTQCRVAPTVQRSIMLHPHKRDAYTNQPVFDFKEKKKRSHGLGLGVGILGGFIAGELIGYTTSTAPESCPGDSYTCIFDRSDTALFSGILGGIIGGLMGGIIGIPISNDSAVQTSTGEEFGF